MGKGEGGWGKNFEGRAESPDHAKSGRGHFVSLDERVLG